MRVLRDVVVGLGTVGLALAGMAGVAALGLWLVGAAAAGPLLQMTIALVSLAAGGSVGLSGAVTANPAGAVTANPAGIAGGRFGGGRFGGLDATVDVMPLGVTACGVLVIVVALLLAARRAASGASGASQRAVLTRVATVAVAFPLAAGLLASFGHGAIAAGALVTVDFRVSVASTVAGAAGWIVTLLGLCWLAVPGTGSPAVRTRWPAVSAVLLVFGGLAVAVLVGGCLIAPWAGARVAGAALLGAPNAVFVAVPNGVGVPFTIGVEGAGAAGWLSNRLPGGHRSVGALSGLAHPLRLAPVLIAAVVLLVVAVLAAARTPRNRGGTLRWAALIALRLGAVMAVAIPAITALAGFSVRAGFTIFGFRLAGFTMAVRGDLGRAVAAGLVAGAVFGFLGSLLWGWAARYRMARRWSHGAAAGRR